LAFLFKTEELLFPYLISIQIFQQILKNLSKYPLKNSEKQKPIQKEDGF